MVEPGKGETRDRVKNQKILQMLAAGEIPQWIAKEWENTKALKHGKRDKQTLIVNSIFDRSAGGKLIMNTEKAMFKNMREDFKENTKKEQIKSLPRRLFMGKFNLSNADLEEGLQAGEFVEVHTSTGLQYSWQQNQQTKKQGEKETVGWDQTNTGGKKHMEMYMEMAKHWQKGLTGLVSGSGSSRDQPSQLALCDADAPLSETHWQAAQKQLIEAQGVLDKLEKDALKLLQVIGPDNKEDPCYNVLFL